MKEVSLARRTPVVFYTATVLERRMFELTRKEATATLLQPS